MEPVTTLTALAVFALLDGPFQMRAGAWQVLRWTS